jgi:hypothetical protein
MKAILILLFLSSCVIIQDSEDKEKNNYRYIMNTNPIMKVNYIPVYYTDSNKNYIYYR